MEGESKGFRITDRVYLCEDCIILYAQLDALRASFIVRVADHNLKCDVCGRQAKFVAIPYERGLWVCDKCYEEQVRSKRNHIWTSYKIVEESQDMTCDICGAKGAKHLMPLPAKARKPVLSVEEDLFERD